MIIGIGLDLCSAARMEKMYQDFGAKLLDRLLHADEQTVFHTNAFDKQMRWLAKRFAAKEAAGKALGIGIGRIGLKNICVYKNDTGQPQLRIDHPAYAHIQWHLSLTDEGDMVAAVALAFKTG